MWQAVSSLGRVVQDWSMNYPSMKEATGVNQNRGTTLPF